MSKSIMEIQPRMSPMDIGYNRITNKRSVINYQHPPESSGSPRNSEGSTIEFVTDSEVLDPPLGDYVVEEYLETDTAEPKKAKPAVERKKPVTKKKPDGKKSAKAKRKSSKRKS